MNALLLLISFSLPQKLLALGGLVLFVYIVFSRRLLSKKNYGKPLQRKDNIIVEKDVLGMEKQVTADFNTNDDTSWKSKSIKIKTILLFILVLIGLYLVISSKM